METYGELQAVIPVLDALPSFADLDAESCYLGFELRFVTDKGQAGIEDAFEFLTEESKVRILAHNCTPEQWDALANALPEGAGRAAELLQEAGFPRPQEEALPEVMEVTGNAVTTASGKSKATGKATPVSSFIRVPSDKLDALINLVGELVIANAGTVEQAKHLNHTAMLESTSAVAGLIEEIRDGALGLRMVQIGETFQRFQRVVRDTAMGLGKQIQLEISGEDTELDKSVVEKIGDPLMHLVRNALDHGIEPPGERLAAGKPAQGCITLVAQHAGGSILIEVVDDGRGLDRDRILAKARANGMVLPDNLPDQDVWQLIFAPGFSTADVVTDVSGRGVGMDVVKRNILGLGGTVHLESRPGQGARVQVRLPLTLAIMDGMTVGIGEETYVLPLACVVESLQASAATVRTLAGNSRVVRVREDWLPVLPLDEVCALPRPPGALSTQPILVVVAAEGRRIALLVDQLVGQQQVVVKNLEANFRKVPNISGATIMGDGRVALILDVTALVRRAAG